MTKKYIDVQVNDPEGYGPLTDIKAYLDYHTFDQIIDNLQKIKEANPGVEIIVDISSWLSSWSDSSGIEVSGRRLETDEEYAARLAKAEEKKKRDADNARKSREAAQKKLEEKEKLELARLKAKYEI
jgi:hypothetical protein